MFSVSQVALRLGVCPKTIRRWDKKGHIKCLRTPGGHRRIPLSEVNRLLGNLHRQLLEDPSRKRCAVYTRFPVTDRRLARFGLEFIERILEDYSVRLKLLYQPE